MIRLATLAAALTFAVCLPAQTGFLKLKVDPGRAGVFADGKYLGPASNFGVGRKYPLPPGEHKIVLREPRYEEVSTTVTIQAGKTATVSQAMKALPVVKGPFGNLRIKHADKFAAVYVNDKFVGHADEFNNAWQAIQLQPGEYEVRIEPVNGQPTRQKVKIEANQTVVVR